MMQRGRRNALKSLAGITAYAGTSASLPAVAAIAGEIPPYKNPALPVELNVGGVTHHEPLQLARPGVHAGEAHQLAFDLFPLGQRVEKEALVLVDGENQFPLGALHELIPVPAGNDHPALGVQGDFRCTAKHDLERKSRPSSPTLTHFAPL